MRTRAVDWGSNEPRQTSLSTSPGRAPTTHAVSSWQTGNARYDRPMKSATAPNISTTPWRRGARVPVAAFQLGAVSGDHAHVPLNTSDPRQRPHRTPGDFWRLMPGG